MSPIQLSNEKNKHLTFHEVLVVWVANQPGAIFFIAQVTCTLPRNYTQNS